jgi:hypothetical protein
MMMWAVHGVPHPIGLATLRVVCRAVLSSQVIAPANYTCEWLSMQHCTVMLHCSGMSACFVGSDDTTYPHIF